MTLTAPCSSCISAHWYQFCSKSPSFRHLTVLVCCCNNSGSFVWKLMLIYSWNNLLLITFVRVSPSGQCDKKKNGCGFDISLAGICNFVKFCMDLVVLYLLLWWTVKWCNARQWLPVQGIWSRLTNWLLDNVYQSELSASNKIFCVWKWSVCFDMSLAWWGKVPQCLG